MPLIDLQTDLKSLKYGQDQPGGGNSGQPYIKVDINRVDTGFNRFRMTKFDDGLIRGGAVGAINASVVDTLRIGKFLKDFPKGPLFIVKQVGLQLSNPQIEHKTNFPTNRPTKGQGLIRNVSNFITNTANQILNAVGPTRIYNLGINTLAQVPVNAFGQHIVRHGFTPRRNDDNLYFKVAQHNNNEGNNRLTQLRAILGTSDNIKTYISGPSSIYGIGNTIIRRRGDFIDINRDTTETEWAVKGAIEAGKTYRLVGHEGGTRDGYVDASRRITSFTGISDKSGSLFAPNATFFNDGKSIQSVFSGRRDYTPLGLDDKIASKDDPKNITYNAVGQEASASAKMRVPDAFVGASTKSSSSLAPSGFPNLTSTTNKPQTLDNKTVSTYSQTLVGSSLTASNALGVSSQYFSNSSPNLPRPDITTYSKIVVGDIPLQTNGNVIDPTSTVVVQSNTPITNVSYNKYKQIIDSKKLRERTFTDNGNQVNAFGLYGNNNPDSIVGALNAGVVLPDSTSTPVYSNGQKVVRINIPWNKVTREIRVGSGLQDQINLTPMFDADQYFGGDAVTIGGKSYNIRDLVRFRIQAVDSDDPTQGKWMVFRAYLTDLSDDSSAAWSEVNYAGRGDKFYIYNGFSRKISISFKVAALSVDEMQFIYQKLNFLMSNTMPDYINDDLLMTGPLVRMSVGNWIDSQLGILNSVNFKVPQDSPWEIAVDKPEGGPKVLILPHVVEVTLSFTPIGSETAGKNLISQKSTTTSNIAQNNTGDVEVQYIK